MPSNCSEDSLVLFVQFSFASEELISEVLKYDCVFGSKYLPYFLFKKGSAGNVYCSLGESNIDSQKQQMRPLQDWLHFEVVTVKDYRTGPFSK